MDIRIIGKPKTSNEVVRQPPLPTKHISKSAVDNDAY